MSGKLKDSHLFCSYTESGNLSFFPVNDVVTASVNSEKTWVKKLIMIIILLIIMNKSQELTVFHGRQKLTSAMI